MTESYDGRQVVGIDLHRRRSVLVRMTEDGRKLDAARIDNSPAALRTVLARAGWPDYIDRHRLQVDSYGGLTAIDYPAGWFAMVQDTILVLNLALGLSFIARQLLTWRWSSGMRRQQLKWLMAGAG